MDVTLDGLTGDALARRWRLPRCSVVRTLPSTLDTIHEWAKAGVDTGALIVADEQSAGRGRDGRTWRSPPGGLWLGLLARPPAGAVGALPLRIGLALADAIDALCGTACAQVKWPNDVLVDGRKVAGILCEARWQGESLQWLAVGIGMNVTNEIPVELRERAVALGARVPGVRRLDVLDHLVPPLLALTTRGGPLTETEHARFARRDWLRGRTLAAPLLGRAAGVRADGALLVDTAAGPGVVLEGHVELS